MYLFASSMFGGLSCFGLVTMLQEIGVPAGASGAISVAVVVFLCVLQCMGRYK